MLIIWSLGYYPQHFKNVFNVRIQDDILSDKVEIILEQR